MTDVDRPCRDGLMAFLTHLTVYVVVMLMLIALDLSSSPGRWWVQWPLGVWGLALLLHGASTLPRLFVIGGRPEGR
jgi:hypothetical protein